MILHPTRNLWTALAIWLLSVITIPAIASEMLSGEALFKIPYYSGPQISPNGKFVIGKMVDDQKRSLVITNTDTQQRYPVIYFAKRNYLRNFYWIDNSSIYIEYIGNKKNKQSIVNLNIDKLEQISPPQQIKIDGYLISSLPETEDEVLFVRQLPEQNLEIHQISSTDLVKGDFSQSKKVQPSLQNARYYSYDDRNQSFFALTYGKNKRSFKVWFLAKDNTKWLVLHDSKNQDYELKIIQYLSDNKFLALTNKNSERTVVAIFDLASREVERVVYEHPKHDIVDAEADEKTGELLSVSYINRGNLEVEYLQEELAQIDAFFLESEDDVPSYTVDTSLDGSKSIVLSYGAAHPGSYVVFDENKQTTKLIEHRFPDLLQHEFSKTRKIDITTESGEIQEGLLTIPWQHKNKALLVMMEPGKNLREELTEFSRSVQYFANRGYAVLRIPYPYPKMFDVNSDTNTMDSINQRLESNVNQLVTKVKQQFDYQQACTMGTGYGAYSAMRLTILFPDDYQCAVSLFGIYDLHLVYSSSNAYALDLSKQDVEDIIQSRAQQLAQSPVYIAQDFDTPLLMVAGEKDELATPEQFNRMKYILEKQNENMEGYSFSNVGHGFQRWYEEQQIHAVMDEFLRRTLALPSLDTLAPEEAAEEYIKLSDMFSFDTLTVNNPFKSFDYLKRASDLGHPRAMFNRGAHYHRGELVIKSTKNAIEWYKKSSDAGYNTASYRLGTLYEDNPDVEQDLKLAYNYYLLADKQGYDASAGLKAAKYVCKGEVVERDVDLCMDLFDIDKIKKDYMQSNSVKVTKKIERMWRDMLVDLILATGNPPEQRAFYKRILNEKFGIVDVKHTFKLEQQGLYSDEGMEDILNEQTSTTAIPDTMFGIRFKMNKQSPGTEKNAIILRLLRTTATLKDELLHQTIVTKEGDEHKEDWFVKEELASQYKQDTTYELQIFNLDAELLYSQKFNVTPDNTAKL